MNVSNITNNKGREVPNQFILNGMPEGFLGLGGGDAFQSYKTMIAFRDTEGTLYLDQDHWNYSPTTSRHRNTFTGLDSTETKEGIKSGVIKLIQLNGEDHAI
jgi:hypothetical protein